MEGTYLNIKKAIFDKPSINTIYSMKVQSFSSKIKNKIKMPTFNSFIQQSIGSSSHGSSARKRKGTQIGKEEVKLSLFADDMILHIENP